MDVCTPLANGDCYVDLTECVDLYNYVPYLQPSAVPFVIIGKNDAKFT